MKLTNRPLCGCRRTPLPPGRGAHRRHRAASGCHVACTRTPDAPGARGRRGGQESVAPGLASRFSRRPRARPPRGRPQIQIADRRHSLAKLGVGTARPSPHSVRPQLAGGGIGLIATPADPEYDAAGRRLFAPTRQSSASPTLSSRSTGSQAKAINSRRVISPTRRAHPAGGDPATPAARPAGIGPASIEHRAWVDPDLARHGRGAAVMNTGQDDPGPHPSSRWALVPARTRRWSSARCCSSSTAGRSAVPPPAWGPAHWIIAPASTPTFRSPCPRPRGVYLSGGMSESDRPGPAAGRAGAEGPTGPTGAGCVARAWGLGRGPDPPPRVARKT